MISSGSWNLWSARMNPAATREECTRWCWHSRASTLSNHLMFSLHHQSTIQPLINRRVEFVRIHWKQCVILFFFLLLLLLLLLSLFFFLFFCFRFRNILSFNWKADACHFSFSSGVGANQKCKMDYGRVVHYVFDRRWRTWCRDLKIKGGELRSVQSKSRRTNCRACRVKEKRKRFQTKKTILYAYMTYIVLISLLL